MSLRSSDGVSKGSLAVPIRVGLVGAGAIAAAHFAGYAQHSATVALRAVCERDPDLRERRSAEWNVPGFADLDRMLAEAEIDAVDICLPHDLHVDAVLAAIRAGKHVLCEKPLAMSVADIDRIAQAADEAGVTVMCAHNQLFRPDVEAVVRLLEEGVVGRVYDIDITGLYRPAFDTTTIGWRGKLTSSGGGELLDSGFHAVYVLLRLMAADPSAVTAVFARHRLDFLPAEDTAYLTVEFIGGGVGTIRSTWAYDPVGAGETIAVHGDLGSLRADASQVEIRRIGEAPEVTALPVGAPLDTYVSEIELFGRALLTGTERVPGTDDARAALEVVLGAYQSAEERRTATLKAPL